MLRWLPLFNHLSINAISHWLAEIQQAPGKPFVKLDTATGPLVLGFESLADRDDAVDLLKQARPAGAAAAAGGPAAGAAGAAKGGTPGEKLLLPTAAQAAALFRADADLESVYKSLVVAGILSESEFWRTRQAQLRDALAAGGGGGGAARVRQRVGLPSAMLADVKPSADGQTEKVHFQLTPQIIRQVGGRGRRCSSGRGAGWWVACASYESTAGAPVRSWPLPLHWWNAAEYCPVTFSCCCICHVSTLSPTFACLRFSRRGPRYTAPTWHMCRGRWTKRPSGRATSSSSTDAWRSGALVCLPICLPSRRGQEAA